MRGITCETELILILLGLSILTVAVSPAEASVNNLSLFGSASQGWGSTPGSMSSPGPAITVTQGDAVNLTLTSQDGLPHEFFVDYNGNGAVDSGEPVSPAFAGTINYEFSATKAGTFTYYCAFHPGIMHGTFTVSALAAADVAVTNVTTEKTVVGQGYAARINVTVVNHGNVDETFNVTTYRFGVTRQAKLSGSASSGWNGTIPGPTFTVNLGDTVNLTLVSSDALSHQFFVDYNGNVSPDPGEPTSPSFAGTITYAFTANVNGTFSYYCTFHLGAMHGTLTVNAATIGTRIDSQTVSPPLAPAEARVLVFIWNATGVPFGNYTVDAVADTVPGEVNTADNTLTDSWVVVSTVGDITGPTGWPDGKVDMRDVGLVAKHFGENVPPAPPNCDLTGPTLGVPDGKIDMRDVGTVAKHFGEQDP